MSRLLSGIRATIRQMLLDEFGDDDVEFETDALDLHISECLDEISEVSPYEVKETLATTGGSRELDISGIDDLIEVAAVEYKTGDYPKELRNFTVFGDTLMIELVGEPSSDGEDVNVYCHKRHQLTETSTTLKPQHERLLIMGVCAKAAISKSRTLIDAVNIGGAKVSDQMAEWGNNKLALYREGLLAITTPRQWVQYSKY